MPDDAATEVRWPDRFVYLCTAGGGVQVNTAPMLHAGLERVVGVVVMIPVADAAQPTSAELAQAILPAERIEAYATRVLRVDPDYFRRVYGNPDLIGPWQNGMTEAASLARELNAEIVFNVTGGRTQAKLGALLGIDGDTPEVLLITVGAEDFIVRGTRIRPGQNLVETPLTVLERLQLRHYLESYGFREANPARRMAGEQRIAARHNLVKSIMALRPSARRSIFSHINRQFSIRHLTAPCQISFFPNLHPAVAQIAAALDDCAFQDGNLTVQTEDGLKFLTGGWLEAAIFLDVSKALAGVPDSTVAANLELTDHRSPESDSKKVDTEFDVVVLTNDKLQLIEAKASLDNNGLHRAIDKLGKYRTQLSGPAGKAWIVAPFHGRADLERAEILAHAEREGVKLLYGSDALAQLTAALTPLQRR